MKLNLANLATFCSNIYIYYSCYFLCGLSSLRESQGQREESPGAAQQRAGVMGNMFLVLTNVDPRLSIREGGRG